MALAVLLQQGPDCEAQEGHKGPGPVSCAAPTVPPLCSAVVPELLPVLLLVLVVLVLHVAGGGGGGGQQEGEH